MENKVTAGKHGQSFIARLLSFLSLGSNKVHEFNWKPVLQNQGKSAVQLNQGW